MKPYSWDLQGLQISRLIISTHQQLRTLNPSKLVTIPHMDRRSSFPDKQRRKARLVEILEGNGKLRTYLKVVKECVKLKTYIFATVRSEDFEADGISSMHAYLNLVDRERDNGTLLEAKQSIP